MKNHPQLEIGSRGLPANPVRLHWPSSYLRNISCCAWVGWSLVNPLAARAEVFNTPQIQSGGTLLAQATALPAADNVRSDIRGNTILPTDVVPTLLQSQRSPFAQTLQMRALQVLPERLYVNGSVEATMRYESNPYQFPTKRRAERMFIPGNFNQLLPEQQQQLRKIVNLASKEDGAFRVAPNIMAGWAITPTTRFSVNYFLIRDSLWHQVRLNTNVQSLAYGVQHDFVIGQRTVLQTDLQARELWQTHQQPVFDILPSMTLTHLIRPGTAVYLSALLQLRGKKYFQAPTKEIDPFYSVGFLHSRNGWTFSNSATFVQNFRQPFGKNAIIRQDNYSFILDFEVARRILKPVAGLQAFVRVEPIFNLHSRYTPGISGTDLRVFGGLRYAFQKRAISTAVDNIRRDIMEEENDDQPANPPSRPSATNPMPQSRMNQPLASLPINFQQLTPATMAKQSLHSQISLKPDLPEPQPDAFIMKLIPPVLRQSKHLEVALKPDLLESEQTFDMKLIPPIN